VPTPIAGTGVSTFAGREPRRVDPALLDAILPGPARERLASHDVLTITTGQQPGLLTGPLYSIYKALSAMALARRLERERGAPVVPVFWVAGDDHDFAEANHVWVLDTHGTPVRLMLRERSPDAPLSPMTEERCGPEITGIIAALREQTPATEFKDATIGWLESAYRPEASLAEAFAQALHSLLGPRGLAVFRAWDPGAKRLMAPMMLRTLDTTLEDGYTPVLVRAGAGRDRLRATTNGFVTRRSEERFSRNELERIADEDPGRLSPNVLLRPALEAALLPTVAYAGGPGELEYFPKAAPLYPLLGKGVRPQPAVARWSAVLVESRVDKVLQKQGLSLEDLALPAGALEDRLMRDALPDDIAALLQRLRVRLEEDYSGLAQAVTRIDPTLERSVHSARNAALGGTGEVERKLVAALKRSNQTLVGQLARARAATFPNGKHQERVLALPSFLIRYGAALVDALESEVARWADAP
jgi:uncharacterized protein YllA (UPF0747 family)